MKVYIVKGYWHSPDIFECEDDEIYVCSTKEKAKQKIMELSRNVEFEMKSAPYAMEESSNSIRAYYYESDNEYEDEHEKYYQEYWYEEYEVDGE